MRKVTRFTFFKNTPFTDLENTIHFNDNDTRDAFFSTAYETLDLEKYDFNFIRDRSTLIIDKNYSDLYGYNYCRFKTNDDPITYYAFILQMEYINDRAVRLYLLIDGIMTFFQGDFTKEIKGQVLVDRQHVTHSTYKKYERFLLNNDDVFPVPTKEYILTDSVRFRDLGVLFQCSVDLSTDFGTIDKPRITTSEGGIYDSIASPVDLYYIDYSDFKTFSTRLSDYPWISQNIQKIILVPQIVIKKSDLIAVDTSKNIKLSNKLFRLKNNGRSSKFDVSELNKSRDELLKIFNITPPRQFLMRSPYCSIEVFTYSGQQILIEPQFLPNTGLYFFGVSVVGYANEMFIFPSDYKGRDDHEITTNPAMNLRGTSLNNAIGITDFDEVPILIDNYKLSLSKTAHQRQLADSKQFSNRLSNVITGSSGNGTQGRLMDAVSLASGVTGGAGSFVTGVFGGYQSEYEYYRRQQAEFKDLAISSPSVTAQTTNNSFNIANNIFGFHVKYSVIDDKSMDFINRFHSLYGFSFNRYMPLDPINSWSIVNFLKFSGNWCFKDIDPYIFNVVKAQFEAGVKFWHHTGNNNPFINDPIKNIWRNEDEL